MKIALAVFCSGAAALALCAWLFPLFRISPERGSDLPAAPTSTGKAAGEPGESLESDARLRSLEALAVSPEPLRAADAVIAAFGSDPIERSSDPLWEVAADALGRLWREPGFWGAGRDRLWLAGEGEARQLVAVSLIRACEMSEISEDDRLALAADFADLLFQDPDPVLEDDIRRGLVVVVGAALAEALQSPDGGEDPEEAAEMRRLAGELPQGDRRP